jgi:predicted transcriptional regulator
MQDEIEVYRVALKEARASFTTATARLRAIAKESEELDGKVSRLRRTITSLAAMCSESPGIDALGITDACIEVMEDIPWPMSTQDVLRVLEEMGFDLASQKNAAASVHAVLARLADKGKIQKKLANDNKTISWLGPNYEEPPVGTEITDDDIPF